MKAKKPGLFRRIVIFVFVLITVLSLLFGLITYFAATGYYEATTQLVNKDVAGHIARFTSPFENRGVVNKEKADSVFYQAMVISPSVEVYFLDTTGKVIAYHGEPDDIRLTKISLTEIRGYLASDGKRFIRGPDPRDPENPKVFSAAPVISGGNAVGFIYVILNGKDYRDVAGVLYKSYAGGLLIKALLLILLATLILTLIYVRRLERNFDKMVGVLDRFESGDFSARFPDTYRDELAPVANVFNEMADLLVLNIDELQKSVSWRKKFTANISHDLRTPLAIARGYAETLHLDQGRLSPRDRQEFLKLIVSKIGSVEHMVQQLLDLSKMESSEQIPDKQPFVFSEIVQEFMMSARQTAEEKGVTMTYTDDGFHSWIEADIRMMERVLQNLFVNAIRYSPSGTEIDCRLRNKEGKLKLCIANTGEPLPSRYESWIKSGTAQDNTLRPQGSGLGLAIVKQVLQLHGFHICLERKDSINIFTVTMPLYSPAEGVSERPDTNRRHS